MDCFKQRMDPLPFSSNSAIFLLPSHAIPPDMKGPFSLFFCQLYHPAGKMARETFESCAG